MRLFLPPVQLTSASHVQFPPCPCTRPSAANVSVSQTPDLSLSSVMQTPSNARSIPSLRQGSCEALHKKNSEDAEVVLPPPDSAVLSKGPRESLARSR
ncbi:uncharacterized protein V6R79_009935 [Siganus canaliculatus]